MEHQRGDRSHPDKFPEARGMAEPGGEGATAQWFDVTVFPKEGPLSARRILLEKEERRKNYAGGSHETEGSGSRVHLRLLRALGNPPDVSSTMLLATSKSRRRPRPLLKRSLPGR